MLLPVAIACQPVDGLQLTRVQKNDISHDVQTLLGLGSPEFLSESASHTAVLWKLLRRVTCK